MSRHNASLHHNKERRPIGFTFPNNFPLGDELEGSPYTSLVEACNILAFVFLASRAIDKPNTESLDGFNGIILVVDGRSRTSQIIDFVHICLIRGFHIMQYKFKAGIALQMSDISFRTGEKDYQTNHLMPDSLSIGYKDENL